MIIAIDPGPEKSALIVYEQCGRGEWERPDSRRIVNKLYAPNPDVIYNLRQWENKVPLAIEMIACYGMAVGAEVFETCVWIGRFIEAYGRPELTTRVPRTTIKSHICHSSKAKDSNIRQAIIDRFGGEACAIGRKKSPGPLYGVSGDLWAALAVALWAFDTQPYRNALDRAVGAPVIRSIA